MAKPMQLEQAKEVKEEQESLVATEDSTRPQDNVKNNLSAIQSMLSQPRKEAAMPEHLKEEFEEEEIEGEEAPYSEEEAQQAGLSQETYNEFGDEAKIVIGILDGLVGTAGVIVGGGEQSRYQAFSQGKKPPPDYYVRAWAGVLSKQQWRLTPEWLLIISLPIVYANSFNTMIKDRTAHAKKKA